MNGSATQQFASSHSSTQLLDEFEVDCEVQRAQALLLAIKKLAPQNDGLEANEGRAIAVLAREVEKILKKLVQQIDLRDGR